MTNLAIQLPPGCASGPCPLCGRQIESEEGPQLCLADHAQVVCRDCGKKHAPPLVALIDLARTAERVGRMGRHTLSPPMVALLDLARAAENYLLCKNHPIRKAI